LTLAKLSETDVTGEYQVLFVMYLVGSLTLISVPAIKKRIKNRCNISRTKNSMFIFEPILESTCLFFIILWFADFHAVAREVNTVA
jgi:hypothetical protein